MTYKRYYRNGVDTASRTTRPIPNRVELPTTVIIVDGVGSTMLLRIAALILGVLELLRPRAVVDFWMTFAVDDDDDVSLRPWVYTAARVEGVVLVLWALRRMRRD